MLWNIPASVDELPVSSPLKGHAGGVRRIAFRPLRECGILPARHGRRRFDPPALGHRQRSLARRRPPGRRPRPSGPGRVESAGARPSGRSPRDRAPGPLDARCRPLTQAALPAPPRSGRGGGSVAERPSGTPEPVDCIGDIFNDPTEDQKQAKSLPPASLAASAPATNVGSLTGGSRPHDGVLPQLNNILIIYIILTAAGRSSLTFPSSDPQFVAVASLTSTPPRGGWPKA